MWITNHSLLIRYEEHNIIITSFYLILSPKHYTLFLFLFSNRFLRWLNVELAGIGPIQFFSSQFTVDRLNQERELHWNADSRSTTITLWHWHREEPSSQLPSSSSLSSCSSCCLKSLVRLLQIHYYDSYYIITFPIWLGRSHRQNSQVVPLDVNHFPFNC